MVLFNLLDGYLNVCCNPCISKLCNFATLMEIQSFIDPEFDIGILFVPELNIYKHFLVISSREQPPSKHDKKYLRFMN